MRRGESPLRWPRRRSISGRLDNAWLQQARPWSLFAWATLGGGILLGAEWAYEQLGWGGYWAWDPVENGSLMPWLTGTALIHGLMTWRQGAFKKTTLFLAIATFGLCNFATFLTRSGIFSSLHAFSQSPIGWMFLFWIAAFAAGGTRADLAAEETTRGRKTVGGPVEPGGLGAPGHPRPGAADHRDLAGHAGRGHLRAVLLDADHGGAGVL